MFFQDKDFYFHFLNIIIFLKKTKTAIHVTDVAKYSPTNTTVTNIWSIRGALIRVIANFPVICVRAHLRNVIAYAYTFCMYTKSIDRTSAAYAANRLVNRQAWISICVCIVARGRTSVFIVIRRLRRRVYCARIYDNIRARNRSR